MGRKKNNEFVAERASAALNAAFNHGMAAQRLQDAQQEVMRTGQIMQHAVGVLNEVIVIPSKSDALMDRLTREQAAVLTALTGLLMGPVEDLYVTAERLLGRPFMTHHFADKKVWAELKEAVRPEFLALVAEK